MNAIAEKLGVPARRHLSGEPRSGRGCRDRGIRPVLILQKQHGQLFQSHADSAAPLTSNVDKKPNQPTHFLLEQVRRAEPAFTW